MLNPEHAKILADAGLDRPAILQRLWELTHYPTERLSYFSAGFAERIKGDTYRCFKRPEDILLLMAGGSGLYSMVMPSWCAGAHQNRYVSQRVELDLYCEIPGLSQS